MKKKLLICSLLLLSFAKDDLIEIEQSLNGRESADFMKTTNNVRVVLEKGTRGKVLESKKMPSGNYGIKIKVQNGAHKDLEVWVYHKLENSALALADKNGKVTTEPEQADQVTAQRKIAAIEDPTSARLKDSVRSVMKLNQKPLADKINPIRDCVVRQELSTNMTVPNHDETMSVPPFKARVESSLRSMPCRSFGNGYDICRTENGPIEKFMLANNGGNNIVKKKEYYINRTFEFSFEDQARSDMQLMISDSPDDFTSHATYSVMVFFPRTYLPSVKKNGDVLDVTLPNGEKVQYNANTREVIGGVFTETPMAQDERGKAKPPGIKYTGAGVVIRADKSGDLPMGDVEDSQGNRKPSPVIATISKKGFNDCKVPSKDIWYTDYNKGNNVLMKAELATDQGFDDFVRKKCGFSIFN